MLSTDAKLRECFSWLILNSEFLTVMRFFTVFRIKAYVNYVILNFGFHLLCLFFFPFNIIHIYFSFCLFLSLEAGVWPINMKIGCRD